MSSPAGYFAESLRLYNQLDRIATLLRSELRDTASRHKLTLAQLQALHYLLECNRFSDTPLALAEFYGTTKGTMSATVSVLEEKGMIEKVGDERDGRVVHCRLTEAGRALAIQSFPPISLQRLMIQRVDTSALRRELDQFTDRLQQKTRLRSFGTCTSCRFFQPSESGQPPQCSVFDATLNDEDQAGICREHSPRPAKKR
ncbi:MarR family winged helix-turn-helix transcriptional regulator [bacterium]|nr:MarR family winged helix-turn-helix transcriptional regulator [bacterium]